MNVLAVSCVCTHNRADLLNATLPLLLSQRVPEGPHEVMVVDNASTDHTHRVVEHWKQRFPWLRYVWEPRLGIAVARNAAIANSQASYLLFFDDDCFVSAGCVERLLQAFRSVHPSPAAVMGRVELLWEGSRPAWYPTRYETLLGRFDRGISGRWLNPDEYFLTMAVAFDAEVLRKVGGFRPDMSHRGRILAYGEDTELYQRMVREALPVYHEPAAVARHWVPQARQQKRWLLKRLYGDGLSQVLLERYAVGKPGQLRRALYDFRQSAAAAKRWLQASLCGAEPERDEVAWFLAQRLGRLAMRVQLVTGIRIQVPGE